MPGVLLVNDSLKTCKNCFHSTILQHAATRKLSFEEQAKQMKNLHKKRQKKLEKLSTWKKVIFVAMFIAFYNLLWCHFDPEQREMLSTKVPSSRKILDVILGPVGNNNEKENSELNVKTKMEN